PVVGGIPVVGRVGHGGDRGVDDVAGRRAVGIADGEGDHVDALIPRRGDPPVERGEQVRRELLDPLCGSHGSPFTAGLRRRCAWRVRTGRGARRVPSPPAGRLPGYAPWPGRGPPPR